MSIIDTEADMTKRLEEAVRRMTPQHVEELTRYAEALAPRTEAAQSQGRLSLTWVGALADAYPEHQSGVDAAHAAAVE